MAKYQVELSLTASSPALTAAGFLYPKAELPDQDPETGADTVSDTESRDYRLAAGTDYVFRFDVEDGDGAFELEASADDPEWSVKKSFDTTKDGNRRLEFEFHVQ